MEFYYLTVFSYLYTYYNIQKENIKKFILLFMFILLTSIVNIWF